jgi:hypothetical protein
MLELIGEEAVFSDYYLSLSKSREQVINTMKEQRKCPYNKRIPYFSGLEPRTTIPDYDLPGCNTARSRMWS